MHSDTLRAIDKQEVLTLIESEKAILRSSGNTERSNQREASNLVYTNQTIGDMVPAGGMSKITVNTVGAAVDILHTHLTKQFLSDKETVVFSPVNKQLNPVADQATKVINHIIHKENDGYKIINTWIKDAAINKNGIVQVTWEENHKIENKEFANVFPEQINAIILKLENDGAEADLNEKETTLNEDGSYNAVITCKYVESMPKMNNVPPEEFFINEEATGINSEDDYTRYVGRNKHMSVGAIIKAFPKLKNKIDELQGAGNEDSSAYGLNYETYIRGLFDGTYYQQEAQRTGTRQELLVSESWIKIDGKVTDIGYCKWVKVCNIGKEVVDIERWDGNIPFASFCFWNVPHKFYGQSVFDRLEYYYRTTTGLLRSELDCRTLQNTPRFLGSKDAINERDFNKIRPGLIDVARGFKPSDVQPLPMPQGSPNTIQLLQLLREFVIAEIGIDPVSGAISKDVEKSGNDAEKTSMVIDNSSAKIELFSRQFAEIGLKEVIWQIYSLLVDNANSPTIKKIVMTVDPESKGQLYGALPQFKDYMKRSYLMAKVGLGHLNSTEKMRNLGAILKVQDNLMTPVAPGGMPVSDSHRINLANEMAKQLGYEGKFIPTVEEITQTRQQIQQAQGQEKQMQDQARMQMMQLDLAKKQAEIEKLKVDAETDMRETVVKEQQLQLNVAEAEAEVALETAQKRPVAIG